MEMVAAGNTCRLLCRQMCIRQRTHHIEVNEATLVVWASKQGTALTSHGIPGAVEVICHDVDHIQGPTGVEHTEATS